MKKLNNSNVVKLLRCIVHARWALVFVGDPEEQPDAELVRVLRAHTKGLFVAVVERDALLGNELARTIATTELTSRNGPDDLRTGYYLFHDGEFAAYDPGGLWVEEMLAGFAMLFIAFLMHLFTGAPMPADADADPVVLGRDRALQHFLGVIRDPVLGRDRAIAPYAYRFERRWPMVDLSRAPIAGKEQPQG